MKEAEGEKLNENSLPEAIRRYRDAGGSIPRLAEQVNTSHTTIYDIINNEGHDIGHRRALKLFEALGMVYVLKID